MQKAELQYQVPNSKDPHSIQPLKTKDSSKINDKNFWGKVNKFGLQYYLQGFGSVFIFLRIRIRIQRIRMEANTDPDTDSDPIRIQGFNDQKFKKNNS
jgi:hypothetical protein